MIANRVRSFEGFGVFANAVILPLYFTSSSIFPLDPSLTSAQTKVVYPEWLVTLVEINPLTYAVDALRGAFIHFHQFDPRLGPIVLVAMAAVFFLIALRDFQQSLTGCRWLCSRPRCWAPLSYLMIFGLLAGVYLLPADTSLSEVRKARCCCAPACRRSIRRSSPATPLRRASTSSSCGRWQRAWACASRSRPTRPWGRTSTRATGT